METNQYYVFGLEMIFNNKYFRPIAIGTAYAVVETVEPPTITNIIIKNNKNNNIFYEFELLTVSLEIDETQSNSISDIIESQLYYKTIDSNDFKLLKKLASDTIFTDIWLPSGNPITIKSCILDQFNGFGCLNYNVTIEKQNTENNSNNSNTCLMSNITVFMDNKIQTFFKQKNIEQLLQTMILSLDILNTEITQCNQFNQCENENKQLELFEFTNIYFTWLNMITNITNSDSIIFYQELLSLVQSNINLLIKLLFQQNTYCPNAFNHYNLSLVLFFFVVCCCFQTSKKKVIELLFPIFVLFSENCEFAHFLKQFFHNVKKKQKNNNKNKNKNLKTKLKIYTNLKANL